MRRDTVVIYVGVDGQHRWRYIAQNGHILADSGQGYSRYRDALTGARRVVGRRRRKVTFTRQRLLD